MTFGEKLKALRIEKNITQVQLAKLSHVTQATICSYEHDRIMPITNTQIALAKALKVSHRDLMKGVDKA